MNPELLKKLNEIDKRFMAHTKKGRELLKELQAIHKKLEGKNDRSNKR